MRHRPSWAIPIPKLSAGPRRFRYNRSRKASYALRRGTDALFADFDIPYELAFDQWCCRSCIFRYLFAGKFCLSTLLMVLVLGAPRLQPATVARYEIFKTSQSRSVRSSIDRH